MAVGGYFAPTVCAAKMDNMAREEFPALMDYNVSSCVRNMIVVDGVELSVQGSFLFQDISSSDNGLSAEIILEGSVQCDSVIWTWFARPNNSEDNFQECSASSIFQGSKLTHCLVTCPCVTRCVSPFEVQRDIIYGTETACVMWNTTTDWKHCSCRETRGSNELISDEFPSFFWDLNHGNCEFLFHFDFITIPRNAILCTT